MKTLARISWLVAGTLLVTRLIASAVEQLFDFLSWTFDLPESFVHRVNAFILLTVSFALVSTLGWLIDYRKPYPLKDNLRLIALTFFLGLSAFGLYMASAPLVRDWKSFQESVQAYDSMIWSLKWAVKSSRSWAVGSYRRLWVPEDVQRWIRPEQEKLQSAAVLRDPVNFPDEMSDADIMTAFETQILQPRPTFSLASALRAHLQSLLLGLAFVVLGLLGFRRQWRRLPSKVARPARNGNAHSREEAETFESLWDYCTANGRAVPVPQRWNGLFEMLIEKRRLSSGGWEPALPLILAAWHGATPTQKQLRFKEHVLWARDHGQVIEIARYLRSLSEKDWYHFGEP